jgi:FMN phosphatase YigB (HAD superfamily)
MQLEPAQCAYLGNKISSDVVGSRNAGFAMALVLESPDKPLQITCDADKPDAIIHQLSELLDIFSRRNNF